MKILAIETSCDETSAAIVVDGQRVLSNSIASSAHIAAATNGVVPEIAAREQLSAIVPVINEAFLVAQCDISSVDAIAVTVGPGLSGSLLVGIGAANALGAMHQKPLIPVHHIAGHIFSNWLGDEIPALPAVVLTVSGGHNALAIVRDDFSIEILGETIDDAAGEAFDKVATMLSLPYPGGPSVSRLAESGNRNAIAFPRPMLDVKYGFDFSFSGLKTAVKYAIPKGFSAPDIAASFEEALCETLATKLLRAAEAYGAAEIHLAGGVSANRRLREKIAEQCGKRRFRFPVRIEWCTDNAAMIGAAAFFSVQRDPSICAFRPVSLDLSKEI